MASILFLYATGLYLKSYNAAANDASPIFLFLDNEVKLQILTDSLVALAKDFDVSSYSNELYLKPEVKRNDSSFEVLESTKHKAFKHLHGNVSISSYLDALEYLCLLLVEYGSALLEYLSSGDRTACSYDNINYVENVLHQFCEFILAAFK